MLCTNVDSAESKNFLHSLYTTIDVQSYHIHFSSFTRPLWGSLFLYENIQNTYNKYVQPYGIKTFLYILLYTRHICWNALCHREHIASYTDTSRRTYPLFIGVAVTKTARHDTPYKRLTKNLGMLYSTQTFRTAFRKVCTTSTDPSFHILKNMERWCQK